jgi:cytoskeletal protein RodZ
MTQYDAGPGEWSDRPWEDPEREPQPHARRRRVALPSWALLAIFIAIVIVLCVSLILVVRAIRGDREEGTPTPKPTATAEVVATATWAAPTDEDAEPPTPTIVLPVQGTVPPTPITEIGPGATIVVQGTAGAGLNLRDQPTTYAKIVASAREGTELTVLDGPREADGYVWWQLQTADGKVGWGAADWLVLKTE